jgi:hypothetical protein
MLESVRPAEEKPKPEELSGIEACPRLPEDPASIDIAKAISEEGSRSLVERLKLAHWLPPGGTTDVTYLNEQTEEVVRGPEGLDVFQRLARIWDELGFSIQQKLDMAVKYSGAIEDVRRFTDAVQIWERAWSEVLVYEKAYDELKYVIRNGEASANKMAIIERYSAPVTQAEQNLMDIINAMKIQLNDEFVMKRKRGMDLIQLRRVKIQNLINQLV